DRASAWEIRPNRLLRDPGPSPVASQTDDTDPRPGPGKDACRARPLQFVSHPPALLAGTIPAPATRRPRSTRVAPAPGQRPSGARSWSTPAPTTGSGATPWLSRAS